MTIDRRDYFSAKQVKKLCDYWRAQAQADMLRGKLNGPRTWMVVDLAINTGLRRAELCDLRVKDINFDEKWILVRRRKKKKHAEDIIPLPDKLAEHIGLYMLYFNIQSGHLLRGSRGPYSKEGIYAAWCTAVKRAKLRHLRLHGCRHTLATQMQRKYKNLRMVQKQLGHTNINTTATFYADVPLEDRQKAANGLWE
jgi:integrase